MTKKSSLSTDSSPSNGLPGSKKAGPSPVGDSRITRGSGQIAGLAAMIAGVGLAAAFYFVVFSTGLATLQRYFAGHPVAIAATTLFCVALSVLMLKAYVVWQQWQHFGNTTDAALAPTRDFQSPSEQFHGRHDAGFVAKHWGSELAKLPRALATSQLVQRLREVLLRQSGRGTTKHLSDDLRELSARDADSAHDSFALMRIIVWAIPMLGFLGTVIGITQTLGGLDFSNGQAAVDNLKSGLYVAFDTTALGLVLSIIAIFLQFPVERAEQQLLAAIDERVGYLTGAHLPGDEAADDQFELLAQLCEGVRVAVAESLSHQTKLWRATIDEAQGQWKLAQEIQSRHFTDAVAKTLAPALSDHGENMRLHAEKLHDVSEVQCQQLDDQFMRWQGQLTKWQGAIVEGVESITKQQATMLDQVDQAAMVREQAASVLELQQALTSNLEVLEQSNQRIDDNLGAAAGQGMADAMLVLARAVDSLRGGLATKDEETRRAA
ncbi:MAG: MotA/TolQ/ExbB proton channel family protein [Planctomycetota bacterium]